MTPTGRALASATVWGLGAGLGTVAGSWLTAAGQVGAGTPSTFSDLLLLPAVAFVATFIVAMAVMGAWRALRHDEEPSAG